MKKMMILCGSPREKGNTVTVVRWVAAAAREGGADVEIVVADKLTYKAYGCTGCMSCQNSDTFRCVIGDDASEVIARIPEQDVLVFATPVYFMGFSAQLKLVIDRMFSLFKIHPESIDYAPSLGYFAGPDRDRIGDRRPGDGARRQEYGRHRRLYRSAGEKISGARGFSGAEPALRKRETESPSLRVRYVTGFRIVGWRR